MNRALRLLEAFTRGRPSLSLAALAQKTGLHKSTILRLAESLESFGYLERWPEGAYRLGAAPLRLGAVYTANLHPEEVVLPVLRHLAERSGESAALYVAAGDARLCAFRVRSPRGVTDNVQQGELLPLDRGAGGLILLAFSGRRGELFDAIRSAMVVTTRGQRDNETAAVACPVFECGRKLAGALSLSGPLNRFTKTSVDSMCTQLTSAARRLTSALGGDGTSYSTVSTPLEINS